MLSAPLGLKKKLHRFLVINSHYHIDAYSMVWQLFSTIVVLYHILAVCCIPGDYSQMLTIAMLQVILFKMFEVHTFFHLRCVKVSSACLLVILKSLPHY